MIVLTLPATLSHAEAPHWLGQLDIAMRHAPPPAGVVIEAAALTHFDSSALALLLQARREAVRQQRPFEVRGAPNRLVVLAHLYGVKDLLGLTA